MCRLLGVSGRKGNSCVAGALVIPFTSLMLLREAFAEGIWTDSRRGGLYSLPAECPLSCLAIATPFSCTWARTELERVAVHCSICISCITCRSCRYQACMRPSQHASDFYHHQMHALPPARDYSARSMVWTELDLAASTPFDPHRLPAPFRSPALHALCTGQKRKKDVARYPRRGDRQSQILSE